MLETCCDGQSANPQATIPYDGVGLREVIDLLTFVLKLESNTNLRSTEISNSTALGEQYRVGTEN